MSNLSDEQNQTKQCTHYFGNKCSRTYRGHNEICSVHE